MSDLFDQTSLLATGNAEVDAEHAELHVEAKRVAALLANPTDPDVVLNALEEFIAQLEAHFRREERLFDDMRPERRESHIKEHDTLILSLRLFAKDIKQGQVPDGWGAFVNLEDVLLKHIILYDLDLRP